jgi:membrane fusion protein (multidrug efflux system)
MNKKIKIIVITGISFLIVFLIALPKINFSSSPENKNQPAGIPVLHVSAHIIKPEKLANKVLTSGSVLANEEIELRSEVAGKIASLFFREGSNVNKGDLLVKINDSELQAQLNRVKYNLKLLEDREFRQRQLLEREAISQEDYDFSLNQLNVARSEIELIEAQVEKTEIRAPFNGRIGLRNVSEGSFVNSTTFIAALQNIGQLKIDFSIPERYAGSVKLGDPVRFRVVGTDGVNEAKVYAIEPKIDPLTRTLKIRAIYPNLQRKILPGSFADVELVLDEIDDALMVPSHSIIPELGGQKVFLFKNGKVAEQKVEIGTRTDKQVQVIHGLNENDTLITSGILQLRSGMPVIISEFN